MKKYLKKPATQAFQFTLARHRNIKHITQYALAKKSGFSPQYISLVESGKRMPTLNFIFCMAESFDMNPKDFMIQLADKFSDYKGRYCV